MKLPGAHCPINADLPGVPRGTSCSVLKDMAMVKKAETWPPLHKLKHQDWAKNLAYFWDRYFNGFMDYRDDSDWMDGPAAGYLIWKLWVFSSHTICGLNYHLHASPPPELLFMLVIPNTMGLTPRHWCEWQEMFFIHLSMFINKSLDFSKKK